MKIAVPTSGAGLESEVNEHFGRAGQFLLVSLPGRACEVWVNPFQDGQGGVGSKVTSALVKAGVEAVFVSSLGPNAAAVFQEAGVRVFHACKGLISTLLDRYESGELEAGN